MVALAGECGPSFLNSILAWFWYSRTLRPVCNSRDFIRIHSGTSANTNSSPARRLAWCPPVADHPPPGLSSSSGPLLLIPYRASREILKSNYHVSATQLSPRFLPLSSNRILWNHHHLTRYLHSISCTGFRRLPRFQVLGLVDFMGWRVCCSESNVGCQTLCFVKVSKRQMWILCKVPSWHL